LINLRKFENDALKVRSEKNPNHHWSAAFDAKALNCTELLRSYLAGGNRIINYHRKPTEIATIEILTKHMAYVFHKNHICFFLSVFKKKTKTLHLYSMCGGVKTKAQREEHVATRLLRL